MQKAITINSKEISLLKPITSADYKAKLFSLIRHGSMLNYGSSVKKTRNLKMHFFTGSKPSISFLPLKSCHRIQNH